MGILDPAGIGLGQADSRYPQALSIVSRGADPAGGDVDARTALDQAIRDAVGSRQAIAWLPMGSYRLKSTYNPSDQTIGPPARPLDRHMRGFTWLGGWGKIGYPPSGGSKIYAAPELIWYGPAGQPMWELDSVVGAAIIGVGLRGRPAATDSNRASIGLNVSQRGAVVGSGTHLLDRVAFNDLAVGVRFGEGQTTGGGNCDTTTFRDCSWQGCDIAIHTIHPQALVYNIEGTSSFTACRQVWRGEDGGYFNIQDFNANGCGGTGANDWMLDLWGNRLQGTNKISRARLEGNCKQFLRVRTSYTEVLIEGLVEAQDNQQTTMFDLTGGQITLVGGKLMTHSASAPTFKMRRHDESGEQPTVRLYGVRLDTERFLYDEWFTSFGGSFPNVIVRDCETSKGLPIPSFSTRLESGLPVPLRAVTTDGTTNVGATLLGNGDIQRTDNCVAIGPGAHRVRMTLIGTVGANAVGALQVRAVREMDVVHDGTTLTMSTPETIGTDHNPDALVYSVIAENSYKHIRVQVRGKAATTITWRAEFRSVGASVSVALPAAV